MKPPKNHHQVGEMWNVCVPFIFRTIFYFSKSQKKTKKICSEAFLLVTKRFTQILQDLQFFGAKKIMASLKSLFNGKTTNVSSSSSSASCCKLDFILPWKRTKKCAAEFSSSENPLKNRKVFVHPKRCRSKARNKLRCLLTFLVEWWTYELWWLFSPAVFHEISQCMNTRWFFFGGEGDKLLSFCWTKDVSFQEKNGICWMNPPPRMPGVNKVYRNPLSTKNIIILVLTVTRWWVDLR